LHHERGRVGEVDRSQNGCRCGGAGSHLLSSHTSVSCTPCATYATRSGLTSADCELAL
jgi:hypothetical protein